MNEFVATIDNEKFNISLDRSKRVSIENTSIDYEVVQLSSHTFKVSLNEKVFHITSSKLGNNNYSFLVEGHYFESTVRTKLEEDAANILNNKSKNNIGNIVKSPMPGLILRINKNIGDSVNEGESLVLLEAMKMENEIRSTTTGIVSEILISEGFSVEKYQKLIVIK